MLYFSGGVLKSRIKEFRLLSGMTQIDLAKRAGVTRQTIISLENGKYKPSLILAMKLSVILKSSMDQLFELEDKDWSTL
jgi:putative transcriptional regulator